LRTRSLRRTKYAWQSAIRVIPCVLNLWISFEVKGDQLHRRALCLESAEITPVLRIASLTKGMLCSVSRIDATWGV